MLSQMNGTYVCLHWLLLPPLHPPTHWGKYYEADGTRLKVSRARAKGCPFPAFSIVMEYWFRRGWLFPLYLIATFNAKLRSIQAPRYCNARCLTLLQNYRRLVKMTNLIAISVGHSTHVEHRDFFSEFSDYICFRVCMICISFLECVIYNYTFNYN